MGSIAIGVVETFPKIGLVPMSFSQMNFQFVIPSLDGSHCKIHTWENKLEPCYQWLEYFEVGFLGEQRNLSR